MTADQRRDIDLEPDRIAILVEAAKGGKILQDANLDDAPLPEVANRLGVGRTGARQGG